MNSRTQPQYECIELTTSDSESSQCPGLDSSDDDGHKDCGLGGYGRCPDNPANYQAMQYGKLRKDQELYLHEQFNAIEKVNVSNVQTAELL